MSATSPSDWSNLPPEIASMICQAIYDFPNDDLFSDDYWKPGVTSLLSLRQVSRLWESAATEFVFKQINVCPMNEHNGLRKIAATDSLALLVKKVVLDMMDYPVFNVTKAENHEYLHLTKFSAVNSVKIVASGELPWTQGDKYCHFWLCRIQQVLQGPLQLSKLEICAPTEFYTPFIRDTKIWPRLRELSLVYSPCLFEQEYVEDDPPIARMPAALRSAIGLERFTLYCNVDDYPPMIADFAGISHNSLKTLCLGGLKFKNNSFAAYLNSCSYSLQSIDLSSISMRPPAWISAFTAMSSCSKLVKLSLDRVNVKMLKHTQDCQWQAPQGLKELKLCDVDIDGGVIPHILMKSKESLEHMELMDVKLGDNSEAAWLSAIESILACKYLKLLRLQGLARKETDRWGFERYPDDGIPVLTHAGRIARNPIIRHRVIALDSPRIIRKLGELVRVLRGRTSGGPDEQDDWGRVPIGPGYGHVCELAKYADYFASYRAKDDDGLGPDGSEV